MSDEAGEQEYEVESIVEAKVEKAKTSRKAKNAKLIWKYRVRWKGYGPQDDTWEPAESFAGSENIVSTFWERANTNSRDISDLSQFKPGESFCHIGPPRPKAKRKSTSNVQEPISQSELSPQHQEPETSVKKSDKRRRSPPVVRDNASRPSKRLRGDPSSQSKQSDPPIMEVDSTPSADTPLTRTSTINRRPPSPEVIPDSDEERNGSSLLNVLSPGYSRKTAMLVGAEQQTSRQAQGSVGNDKIVQGSVLELEEELMSRVPAHRAREANPRVKVIDDPNMTRVDGAISAKAHAITRVAARASSSHAPHPSVSSKRSKPGPGRSSAGLLAPKNSSLLTAEKGSLKTVKVKYVNEDSYARPRTEDSSPIMVDDDAPEVDAVDEPAPTGGELLQLAGLDPQAAESLPDFEEVAPEQQLPGKPPSPKNEAKSSSYRKDVPAYKYSIEMPKHTLFLAQPSSDVPESLSSKWKQSTIFGPLTLGTQSINKADVTNSSTLFVNLDASVSIPVLVHAAQPESTCPNFDMAANGTPGKFYSTQAAINLLSTVRIGGTPARIAVAEDTSSEAKEHLSRFSLRLKSGDLFVAIAGTQILVFCASGNTVLSHRLNAPSSLLNEPDAILVVSVVIENFSGYADAASTADDTQWTQYVHSHQ